MIFLEWSEAAEAAEELRVVGENERSLHVDPRSVETNTRSSELPAHLAPLLASAGYRVIVPYLRGCGSTRFLLDETVRNGPQSALGVDVVALMDALGIGPAIVAGFLSDGL